MSIGRPAVAEWDARASWFWDQRRRHPPAGDAVGAHAGALAVELEAVFCAGAWATVVILAFAVVEAQLREAEANALKRGRALARDWIESDRDLAWLRMRRNELVHADPDAPAVTEDALHADADRFERDARRAVDLTFRTLAMSPWL